MHGAKHELGGGAGGLRESSRGHGRRHGGREDRRMVGEVEVTRRWKKEWKRKERIIDERNSLCHIHGNDD